MEGVGATDMDGNREDRHQWGVKDMDVLADIDGGGATDMDGSREDGDQWE